MLCFCLHPFNVNDVRMKFGEKAVTMRATLTDLGIKEWSVIDVTTRGPPIPVSPDAEKIGDDLVRNYWKHRHLGQRGHDPGHLNPLNVLYQIYCGFAWTAVMCSTRADEVHLLFLNGLLDHSCSPHTLHLLREGNGHFCNFAPCWE